MRLWIVHQLAAFDFAAMPPLAVRRIIEWREYRCGWLWDAEARRRVWGMVQTHDHEDADDAVQLWAFAGAFAEVHIDAENKRRGGLAESAAELYVAHCRAPKPGDVTKEEIEFNEWQRLRKRTGRSF